jgi:hypothetical protein
MENGKQIRLAGSPLGRYCHACAFFSRREEEYRVQLPFIREGVDQGERTFQIIDGHRRDEHARRLREAGINVGVDALRVHPMVILGGTLQENPFYVPPDEFLRELRQRDANAQPMTVH